MKNLSAVSLCGLLCLALTMAGTVKADGERDSVQEWRHRLLSSPDKLTATISQLASERRALARAVNQIIEDVDLQKQQPKVVGAAMKLAGELQLTECTPALGENIQFTVAQPSTLRPDTIDNYPAGLALIRMGFASVPVLLRILIGDDADDGFIAVCALCRLPHKGMIVDLLEAEKARATSEVTAEVLATTISIIEQARKDEERWGTPAK